MAERIATVGEAVIYTDTSSVDHAALVTVVHGAFCINLLYVSDNPEEQDQYGRQIKRFSSVSIMSDHTAHGNYFRFPDQEKKAYSPPLAR